MIAIASLGMTGAALQQQADTNLGSLTNEVSVSGGADSGVDGVTAAQLDDVLDVVVDGAIVPQRSDATTLSTRSGDAQRVTPVTVTRCSSPVSYTPLTLPAKGIVEHLVAGVI